MKKIILSSSFAALLLILTLINGCKKDDPGTGGGTFTNADYVGSYTVQQTCPGQSPIPAYTLTITKSGTAGVVINNPSNLNYSPYEVNINGTVSDHSLTIPQQTASPYAFQISGSGTLSNDKKTLTLTFITTDGGSTSTCTATATRK